MIVDSSALIAILREELEAKQFSQAILRAEVARLSCATYVETAVVVDAARKPIASRRLDQFITEADLVLEPFTPQQARIARDAYRDYGKGSGHPARLNFGDCMAYALATDKREALLFKGSDFDKTDVQVAET